MTRGEQIRDYLEVQDLITYVIDITKSDKSVYETVNVCSGKGLKLCDLAMSEAKLREKESLVKIGALPYRDNEVWEMVGDNQKLRAIINPNK